MREYARWHSQNMYIGFRYIGVRGIAAISTLCNIVNIMMIIFNLYTHVLYTYSYICLVTHSHSDSHKCCHSRARAVHSSLLHPLIWAPIMFILCVWCQTSLCVCVCGCCYIHGFVTYTHTHLCVLNSAICCVPII